MAIDVDLLVIPGPPENAAAAHTSSTEVELTWDASTTPIAYVASYTVFYKKVTEPSYPLTPQITRSDLLGSYSESITVDEFDIYDFIVYTNTNSGHSSSDVCDSCHTNNIPTCSNGVIDLGEECDGLDLGGALCTDFGFVGGVLGCSAVCEYDETACILFAGGGGAPVDEDNISPNPGTASSPEYASTSPFTVTYSGATDTGGSGLNYVALLAKRGTGSWINTGMTSTGDSGSFNFVPDPEYANATYYFGLQAFDNDGNQSDTPFGSGDTSTIYDSQNPTIETITVPASVTEAPFVITYENAVDTGIAGLLGVELWYRIGEEGEWINSGLLGLSADGAFEFEFPDEPGLYYFDLIAVDMAGNKSTESDEYATPVIYDLEPPYFAFISAPAVSTEAPIVISYEGAVDEGPAGLKSVELWYKKETDGLWTNSGLISTTTDGTFDFVPPEGSGTYYFDLVLEDNVGNRSASASGDGLVSTIYTEVSIIAELTNLPDEISEVSIIDVGVGGEGIVAYMYKLNEDEYSEEIHSSNNIVIADLPEGEYSLEVIGKNLLGQWQEIPDSTKYSWSIVLPEELPLLVAEEGEPDEEVAEEVVELEEELEVILSVLAKPMGRAPGVYDSVGLLNLYSPIDGNTIKSAEISLGRDGAGQSIVTDIPADTYNIGLKSNGYLQKILTDIILDESTLVKMLDFTLGGTFLLIGGDVFSDNIVNSFDLALMLQNYLAVDANLDMNRDGLANAADLAMILRNYQLIGDSP